MDKVVIIGGGTFSDVRSHLALAARAFGTTARKLTTICENELPMMEVELALTAMANAGQDRYFPSDIDSMRLVTNEDVKNYIVNSVLPDPRVKIIFFSAAMCDFNGSVLDYSTNIFGLSTPSGKYEERLTSSQEYNLFLTTADKVITLIHQTRPDIFVVGFKTTTNEDRTVQITKARKLLDSGCNLVVANDTGRRRATIVHEFGYSPEFEDREVLLIHLVNLVGRLVYGDEDDINTEPSADKRWKGPDDYLLPRKTPKEGLNKV